jgi:hypothetical protein
MNRREKMLSGVFVALAFAAVIFYIIDPLSVKTVEQKKDYNAIPFRPDSFFKKYLFPLKVDAFVSTFSKPNDTYVDKNEGCPIGQMHNWLLKDQNIELLVLGDCYNPEVDYSADSRLYAVRKIDYSANSSFEDVWGVKLGDSDAVVKEKLEKLIKIYPGLHLVQDTNGSPVHCHVAGKMKHQYVLSKDGMYLFFIIDTNDLLETIMYTEMDVRAAC